MLKYIYEKKKSLDKELCLGIIEYFENNPKKQYKGVVGYHRTQNENQKLTMDMVFQLPYNEDGIETDFLNILLIELNKNVKDYVLDTPLSDMNDKLIIKSIQIQKYTKNLGKFETHTDCDCEDGTTYRVITFIWYLNDVDDGGETEFFGNHLIKPEQGKLCLFPSDWFVPHKGRMPISDNKYIVTGWIYL
jgi:uncharacterized protein YrzB (UPF0473 family)